MDLRTIMNNDATGSSEGPPSVPHQSPSQTSRKPSDPIYAPRDQRTASYPSAYPTHPQQPPPLQPPHTSPERSSSYGSLQSPYQYQPPPAPNASAQSQRVPSPPPYGSSRDSYSAYGHPQQQQQQQQSPFAQQRSQSIQSVLTPSSTSTYSFLPRESSPTAAPQAYPSQHFPPQAQGSMPGTPRGSVGTSYHRQTPPSGRPPSSGHESLSNRASSPWVGPDAQVHMSPTAMPRIARQDSRSLEQTPRQMSSAIERRDSDESVSPKTAFPGSRQGSAAGHTDLPTASQSKPTENGMSLKESPPVSHNSHPAPQASQLNSSPPARASLSNDSSSIDQPIPSSSKMELAPDVRSNSSPQVPRLKRRRYNEPPIYAQKAVRTKGRIPEISNPCPMIPRNARNSTQNPFIVRQRNISANATVADTPAKIKQETPPVNGPPAPVRPSEPTQTGSLGPWEPSISGKIPYEEVTNMVCDFLFQNVVVRNDAAAVPAGTTAVGQGAIIEVEAKLGQLVDQDRGERLRLPVLTETIVNKENSRVRTAFESTMTLAQHRVMNKFLNDAVKASMPHTNPGRIQLSYAHKKERDMFYEVSPSDLPQVIRQNLNPRHKPKVRVTVDQRTGEVLAKIVKCRIADMDVYSPRTCVDWRISINLEMNYEGDVSHLTMVEPGRGRGGERNKDRMSYRHLAYQIDLTQVARSEPSSKGDFEHELEVEISAAEIRRQGQLAINEDPNNQYEELVKGFVDNIRLLARAVPA
ncbi:CYTH-like domain-containing protein [Aspergillus avenaceus]|uniref:mRNA-capping enzyme subunit beta n=1 Tax=Aspergillus avenaceus TaxID=36643 RepID=A0A5N6U1Q2_ASPAV|nr:CYTH-like domain-containing protein [Aspergillus avenaceus]